MNTHRRGFLGHVSTSLLMLVSVPSLLRAETHARTVIAPDEAWLEGLTGKHRQFFDVAAASGGAPLNRVRNFLDVYHDAYDQRDETLNAVVGAHGSAIVLLLNDSAWSSYGLGARAGGNDPALGAAATRNPFAGSADASTTGAAGATVAALQRRGVRFLACRQSMARLSREIAAGTGRTAAEVNESLLASLLPGVTAVPAMIIAGNRAQEAGLTYAYLG